MSKLNEQLNEFLMDPERSHVRVHMKMKVVNKLKDHYALTFNIASGVRVNRKKWEEYSQQQQINLLSKILNSACIVNNVTIDWSRFVIEQCPSSWNMHIHCVVVTHDRDLVEKVAHDINCKYNPKLGSEYVTLMFEELFCDEGWENYIRKNTR